MDGRAEQARRAGRYARAVRLCKKLETACLRVIESGRMTKDLAALWENGTPQVLTSDEFLSAVRTELEK